MINSEELQTAYTRLYKQLRKYTWDFCTVQLIADLEISVYRRIPNMSEIRSVFSKLRSAVQDIVRDDGEFQSEVDAFQARLDEDDEVYTKLNQVREVITI